MLLCKSSTDVPYVPSTNSSFAPSAPAMLRAMSIAAPDQAPVARSFSKNGVSPGNAAIRSTPVRRTRSSVAS